MGSKMSKKIIIQKPTIPPHNQPIKVDETREIHNQVLTWNQQLQLWKDTESRLGRL